MNEENQELHHDQEIINPDHNQRLGDIIFGQFDFTFREFQQSELQPSTPLPSTSSSPKADDSQIFIPKVETAPVYLHSQKQRTPSSPQLLLSQRLRSTSAPKLPLRGRTLLGRRDILISPPRSRRTIGPPPPAPKPSLPHKKLGKDDLELQFHWNPDKKEEGPYHYLSQDRFLRKIFPRGAVISIITHSDFSTISQERLNTSILLNSKDSKRLSQQERELIIASCQELSREISSHGNPIYRVFYPSILSSPPHIVNIDHHQSLPCGYQLPLVAPPYPWATNSGAELHSLKYLSSQGLESISGVVECAKCDLQFTIKYEMERVVKVVQEMVELNVKYDEFLRSEGKEILTGPGINCEKCNSSTKPFMDRDMMKVNWLFLLVNYSLGFCNKLHLMCYCVIREKEDLILSEEKLENEALFEVLRDILKQLTSDEPYIPPL